MRWPSLRMMFSSVSPSMRRVSYSSGADEVLDLVYALKRPYRKSAAFITNDQTLAVLRKLKDNNGA